jgi:adenosylhomocysteine nucleosidase
MLIWVAALHCEAKPVIDRYRLRKQPGLAFDVYHGDDMALVVSGIGKLASAAACAWIAALHEQQAALAWLNLGIAGAAEDDIGDAFLLHQVVDDDSGKRYYPVPVASAYFPGNACRTLGKPVDDYRDDCLFDMEASGFMQGALYFSSAELVQCIKLVSDNRQNPGKPTRQQVSDLVHARIDEITRQAEALAELARGQAALEPTAESWQQLLSLAHFSQTQQSRLRASWRYLHNRGFETAALLNELSSGADANAIIAALEEISHRDSEAL